MNNTPNDRRPPSGAQRGQQYPRPRPSAPPPGDGRRPVPQSARPQSGYRRSPETPTRRPVNEGRRPASESYNHRSARSAEDYLMWFLIAAVVLLVALIVTFIIVKATSDRPPEASQPSVTEPSIPAGPSTPDDGDLGGLPNWKTKPSDMKAFVPKSVESTAFADGLNSEYGILVSLSDGTVLASKKADERMYPASMTKIMTVIVACENITDMWDTFTITTAIRWPLDNTGASMAYFKIDKPIYLVDLIYGAMLPSGADATAALAIKVAGSEEAFVDMMNAKAAEIGCTNTHFTNTSGLENENHYSTARDIATIISYAIQNPFIKEVLCSRSYATHAELEKDDNVLYATWSNTLASMSGDYSFFMGAKTGYETNAGSCMASLIKDSSGREYVAVTAKAGYSGNYSGRQNAFRDVKTLYDAYIK